MEELFPGSYRPSKTDLEQLLREATVAFDASVLLHVYRYSEDARNQLLDAMERLGDRLWIPYQAIEEFHRNREAVIGEQHTPFQPIKDAFAKLQSELAKHKRHPSIDLAKLRDIAQRAAAEASEALESARERRISVSDDAILQRLTEVVGDKFGSPPTSQQLEKHYEVCRDRYSRQVPPGYADAKDKAEPERYGDYLLWRELLDHAASTKDPVILVTDDLKEDWWLRQHGERIGPRHELIAEMREQSGVPFHIYTPEQFLTYAQTSLEVTADAFVIEEVRDISRDARSDYDRLREQLLDANWSIGSSTITPEGVMLTLRPWPDTWSLSGPHTLTTHGRDELEALRNALEQVADRAGPQTVGAADRATVTALETVVVQPGTAHAQRSTVHAHTSNPGDAWRQPLTAAQLGGIDQQRLQQLAEETVEQLKLDGMLTGDKIGVRAQLAADGTVRLTYDRR